VSINSNAINSDAVSGSGAAVAAGEGSLVSFTQTVELFVTGSGQLVSFEQMVENEVASSPLVAITQTVVAPFTTPQFVERNGWYPIVKIGTYRVPDNLLTGNIQITRSENDAAQLSFSIKLPAGVWDYNRFIGKTVTVDDKASLYAPAVRVYTGIVNLPDIDLINHRINFSCSDNRREQIKSQLSSVVKSIGYYNVDVFGEAADVAEELDNRLTTVPYSVDFNQAGKYTLTSMLAKASPDFTLYDEDVYREGAQDPQVKFIPRGRIVNKINLTAEYRYQRLYHREVTFTWDASNWLLSPCEFLTAGYSIPSREMIRSAVQGTGWPVKNEIVFTEPLASGTYSCGTGTAIWSTEQTQYTQVAVTQTSPGSGTTPVLDSNGAQVYQSVPVSSVDLKDTLAAGAAWTATKRWVQTLSEVYNITVSSPQSITQYGEVSEEDSAAVTSEFDTRIWEDYTQYRAQPSGQSITTSGSTYYFAADTNLSGWYAALYVMLNRAKTSIIKSHRDTRVVFETEYWPEIDLVHTVYLDCTQLQAQGKVYSVKHTLNVDTGEAKTVVELALSLISGSGSNTALSAPSRPTYTPNMPSSGINLDSHFGEQPQSSWTGYIGNKWTTERQGKYQDTKKTKFTEQFIVEAPGIESSARDNQQLATSASYNVAIQNDLLVITGV